MAQKNLVPYLLVEVTTNKICSLETKNNQKHLSHFDGIFSSEKMSILLFVLLLSVYNTYGQCRIDRLLSCEQIPVQCLECSLDTDCIYGDETVSQCRMLNGSCFNSQMKPVSIFHRSYICRYCYQTPLDDLVCTPNMACRRTQNSNRYKANCTIADDTQLCLGHRAFYRNIECNWTSGYKKSAALIISIFLGGLGLDRFYLGHIKEGFGKLFSFGGLGIWTLIDAILIACGYLKPEDGSVYVE